MLVFIGMAFLTFGATEYDACQKDGLGNKACIERTVANSEPVDYSKMND